MKSYFSRLLIRYKQGVWASIACLHSEQPPPSTLSKLELHLQEKMQVLFPAVLNPLCAAAVGEGLWVTHQPGSSQPFYFSQATCRPVLEVNSSLPPSFTNGCKSCRCRNLNTNPGEPGTIVLLPWYLFVTSVTLQSLANSSCVKKGQGVSASGWRWAEQRMLPVPSGRVWWWPGLQLLRLPFRVWVALVELQQVVMAFRNPGWRAEAMEVGLGEDELEWIERKLWGRRLEAGPEVRQLKKSKQSLTLFCLTIFSVASINLPLLVGVELQPFQSICTGQLICTEFPSQVSKPHDSMQRTSFYWQISTSLSRVEKWHLDYLNPV